MPKPRRQERERQELLEEFRREAALERFQEEKPQLWMQSQRVHKLIDIQQQLGGGIFPEGSCFLHANLVGQNNFCVRKVTGIDLDTCQVTLEVYGDEDAEGGIVVLPLEAMEWLSFPAKAVPVGVHFEGFISRTRAEKGAAPRGEATPRDQVPVVPVSLLRGPG
jgi:hypothetical protein